MKTPEYPNSLNTDHQNSLNTALKSIKEAGKSPTTSVTHTPSLDSLLEQTREQGTDLCQLIEALSVIEHSLYGNIQTEELKSLLETAEACEKSEQFPGKISLLHTQVCANRNTTVVALRCLEALINRTVGN